MFFIHNLSLPDLHPYANGIKSTWNVSRLCSLRSKTWFLHRDCHRVNSEEGLWNITHFFPGPRVNVWICGQKNDIFQHPNSSNWCFSLFKYPRSGTLKNGIMLSSRTDFLGFFIPPTPHTSPLNIFAPFFCLLTKFCLPRLYMEL